MTRLSLATTLLTTTLTTTNVASAATPSSRRTLRNLPYLTPEDIQSLVPNANYDPISSQDKWVSIDEEVQFLPLLDPRKLQAKGEDMTEGERHARELADQFYQDMTNGNHTHGAYDQDNPYSVQPFIEGMGGYDEYQQAWRLLGFIIDCNEVIYDDDYEEGGHSNDGTLTGEGCGRYVLWAAYVDTEYEGGGIGEYQYWDRTNNKWDDSACYVDRMNYREFVQQQGYQNASAYNEAVRGNDDGNNYASNYTGNVGSSYKSRCAKMDCHEEGTHFSVLGFFKHRSHDDWMEQLFKHEGMCVWTDEEYAFMKKARRAWPKGCTDTGSTGSNGKSLYYDIKPLRNGRITLGLYTDTACLEEYSANTKTVENILGNVFANIQASHDEDNGNNSDYSGDSLSDSMKRWDSAFDVWHTCHPCVAYDIENTDGSRYYTDDDDRDEEEEVYYDDDQNMADDAVQRRQRSRKLGGEHHSDGDSFDCYDDAGYTNVNQCMKFSAKTVMKTATFRDLSLGRHQGTLAKNPLSGYVESSATYHKHRLATAGTYLFLIGATGALAFTAFNLYNVVSRNNVGDGSNRDSLL